MSVNRPSEEENERFNNSEDSAENTDSSAHSSQSNADEGVSLPPPPPPRGQRRERLEKEQQEKIREEYEKRHGLGEWSASEEETSAEKPSITKNATSLPPLGGNEEGNDDGTESIDDEEGLSDDTDDGIKSTEQFDDTETVVDYANIAPASHESVGNDDPQSTQVIVQPPESGNETLPELSEATDTEASRDDLNAALAGAMHQKYEKDKQLLQDQDPEEAHPEKKGKKTKIITAIIVILILAVGAMVTWWLTSENNDDDEVLDSSPVETENTEAPEEEEEEEEVEMVVVPEAEPLGPEQTEIDESAICEPFIDVGLECSVSEEFDDEDEIERGEIISQSVEAGEEAEVETEIEVVYSAGPESSTMPEIYNEPVDETVGRLYELGVDIEDTVYEEGSNLREDNVISASVEAEETVEAGDTVENGALVTLTVSDGTVEVPDWTEELQETVEEESAELNVSVELEAEESEETAGTVLSQSDVGIVDFDSEITVNIAVPFENVPLEIPDVVDESPELAQSDLSEVGFRNITSVTVPSGEVDEPTVTQVVPGVGSTGMSEEQVVLIVSEPIDEDSDEEN